MYVPFTLTMRHPAVLGGGALAAANPRRKVRVGDVRRSRVRRICWVNSVHSMLSLLNIKHCLLAFKCHASSPLISIHPPKRKFWSQPVTLLCRGRAYAVLVYLAFDLIKMQHVTFLMLQTTFPRFTHVFFWPQIQTNINNKSQPRPSMSKSYSPKKARQPSQIQIWQSSFYSFEVLM